MMSYCFLCLLDGNGDPPLQVPALTGGRINTSEPGFEDP
uniref:Uncharacterized protein n=1 Tax=Rhizophora mucronata TaxID=61149 RepID=A0A2P2QKI4_RHIMU